MCQVTGIHVSVLSRWERGWVGFRKLVGFDFEGMGKKKKAHEYYLEMSNL